MGSTGAVPPVPWGRLSAFSREVGLACAGPEPPHPWAVPARQDLHLNRTMLDDQGSPYVGRFACGWHRLPENLSPGNHRPERGSGSSIARAEPRPDRPRRDQQAHPGRAPADELGGAGRRGGPRREDVVDEEHVLARGPNQAEPASHGLTPVLTSASGLGAAGIRNAFEEPDRGAPELARHHPGQGLGLVEPPAREPTLRERDPRHEVARAEVGRAPRHLPGKPLGHAPPPTELQPVDRSPGGALEQERGSGSSDRIRRAVAARGDVLERRCAAALAPRRAQRDEGRPAGVTERRAMGRATIAPRAPRGEQQVERPPQHRRDATAARRQGPQGKGMSRTPVSPRAGPRISTCRLG